MENKYEHITAAVSFTDLVRTTLGPRGMNKMVVGSEGTILTNDGATIIGSMRGGNPIFDLFKNLAKSQEEAVGDGTTTATVLSGQLLQNALILINKGIHPTVIINGYNLARVNAMKFLEKSLEKVDKKDIIRTAFGTKIAQDQIEFLADLLLKIKEIQDLKIYLFPNSDFFKSEVFNGHVFDGFTINERMKSEVEGEMAVLDFPVNLKCDNFQVTDAKNLEAVSNYDTDYKRRIVNKLVELNVKCVFYTDTNPEFETYLTEKGITGIVVFARENVDGICKTIGANAASNYDQIRAGWGKMRYTKTTNPVRSHGTIYVSGEGNLETLVLRGPTSQTLDEIRRAVDDVVGLLRNDLDCVVGAGAIEIEIANDLREFAKRIGGKEQLAIEKYAEAIESIPAIIAENCGLDAIDVLTNLKTLHSQGQKDMGVDEFMGVSDARKRGIFEPALIKIYAISSATNVTNLILKLDGILQGEMK